MGRPRFNGRPDSRGRRLPVCDPCPMADRPFHRYSTAFPAGHTRPTDWVELGPDLPHDLARKLLGDVTDKRVLELGCGMGHSSIAMAAMGARVTAIDDDAVQIDHARELCAEHEVSVELHRGDLAELAFLPADGFDVVVAIHSIATVRNPDRVFRQVHRLLRSDCVFVLSAPHPAAAISDPFDDEADRIVRPWFGSEPLGSGPSFTHRHAIDELFGGLVRANFGVDTLIESRADDPAALPQAIVLRGRKIGD